MFHRNACFRTNVKSAWSCLHAAVLGLTMACGMQASATENKIAAQESDEREPVSLSVGNFYNGGYFGHNVPSTTHSRRVMLDWTMLDTDFEVGTNYLSRTGPAGTIIRRVGKKRTETPRIVSSEGPGDVFVNVNKEVWSDAETAVAVDVLTGVNFGYADAKAGLGTGKDDFYAGVGASYPFEHFLLSGGLKYWVLGSPGNITVNGIKENIELRNIWASYITLSTDPLRNVTTLLTLRSEQSPDVNLSAYRTLELSLQYRFHRYGGVRATFTRGFTSGSPERGASIELFAVF